MTQPAANPSQASTPVVPSAATTATVQPAATPVAPASTGGSKYGRLAKPIDPARAKRVADSFTRPVEDRKYYGHTDTGGGMMGITYGGSGKEKLPAAAPTTAGAVTSANEQDAATKDLTSGLTDANGTLDAEQLEKAMDAICAQRGFKNHTLIEQIRTSTEQIIVELRPSKSQQ